MTQSSVDLECLLRRPRCAQSQPGAPSPPTASSRCLLSTCLLLVRMPIPFYVHTSGPAARLHLPRGLRKTGPWGQGGQSSTGQTEGTKQSVSPPSGCRRTSCARDARGAETAPLGAGFTHNRRWEELPKKVASVGEKCLVIVIPGGFSSNNAQSFLGPQAAPTSQQHNSFSDLFAPG